MTKELFLPSKPRYDILDGLRGVAALVILLYHVLEGCGVVLGHGYLGVDFFYVLSGFVIGYAYDDRWGRMNVGGFFKRRIIRLHPMVIMGTAIGLALYYFQTSDALPLIGQRPWWVVLLLFFYCCLMLPMPNAWDIRGWQDTNSFNGNIWSLYWEYLANICYAFFLRFVPTIVPAALTVVAAVATLDLTLNLNLFGLISESRVGAPYTVNGGWSLAPSELYVGAVRLGYPFLVGMMLSRTKRLVRMKGGFVWTALLVAALLLMPAFEGIANGVYEAFAILVVMPLIVSIGAGSQLTGRKYNAACKFLGDLSYPLYITHLPVVSLQIAYVSNHPEAPLSNLIMVSVLTFFLSVAVAYACLKLYDVPVRRWLQQKWTQRPATCS